MNFVFLSPNFPENYWMFIRGLKRNGLRTLGIGDCPYDNLAPELKAELDEYYKVDTLEDYDQVYRGVAYFAFKYGKIDWLESNNEYWLLRDAKLRDDFNITTGIKSDKIQFIRYKHMMKECYEKAGVPSARWHLVESLEGCQNFVKEVGFPVIVKPDNGVGAAATYKVKTDEELVNFYNSYDKTVPYLMEEFVKGDLYSYDGIVNSKGEIVFETAHFYPDPVMDIVNEQLDSYFWSLKEIPENLKEAGHKTIENFPCRSRFYHCEFFKLTEDREGLGKKGDIVGLEVNMRPPGGSIPDMMNFANNIDVYQIWADMVAYDGSDYSKERPYSCCFYGRRDAYSYVYSNDEIKAAFPSNIRMHVRLPEVIGRAMGNEVLIAVFPEKDELDRFVAMCNKKA